LAQVRSRFDTSLFSWSWARSRTHRDRDVAMRMPIGFVAGTPPSAPIGRACGSGALSHGAGTTGGTTCAAELNSVSAALRSERRRRDELAEELQRVEHDAARMEAEVRRARAENERMIGEIIGPSVTLVRSHSKSESELAVMSRCMKSESALLVESLAAELRAEMQCLWADGREVRALASRREMELRTMLSRSVAEEHAEARAARRVRDAAARKVAAARRELDAAIREVASNRSEQATSRASSTIKPAPGTIVRAVGAIAPHDTIVHGEGGDDVGSEGVEAELRVMLQRTEARADRLEREREREEKKIFGG